MSYGISDVSGDRQHYLLKYNSASVREWTRTWGMPGGESAAAVVRDAAGNSYAFGDHNNNVDSPSALHLATDGFLYASGSINDGISAGAIRKFQLDGTEVTGGWDKRFASFISGTTSCQMTSDADGNLYVVTVNNLTGNNDWFVRKFAPDGGEFSGNWSVQIDISGGADQGLSVTMNAAAGSIKAGGPTATDAAMILRLDEDGRELARVVTDFGNQTPGYIGSDVDAFGRLYFAGAVNSTSTSFNRLLLRLEQSGQTSANPAWQGREIDAGFGESDFFSRCMFSGPLRSATASASAPPNRPRRVPKAPRLLRDRR